MEPNIEYKQNEFNSTQGLLKLYIYKFIIPISVVVVFSILL
jgi:hypothetical protein